MIIERDPPLARNEINETQLRMLQRCNVPSLLPIELEECDGRVSLRYALTGTRMLTEAMRASWWSMSEAMEALCKLADMLEECRLYMLEAERVRLQDEFIFVANDAQDLRFTYLPLVFPAPNWKEELESLIVRWMIRVKEPNGLVFQQVLRLVSSVDFVPAALSRLGKRYLVETASGAAADFADIRRQLLSPVSDMRPQSKEENRSRSRSWDLLHPVSGDPQPVSELWGDPGQFRLDSGKQMWEGGASQGVREQIDPSRWQIILLCAASAALAAIWKYLYLDHRSQQLLMLAACLTLIVGATVLLLWSGVPKRFALGKREENPDEPSSDEIDAAFRHRPEEASGRGGSIWSPPAFAAAAAKPPARQFADDGGERGGNVQETTWLSGRADQTTLLDQHLSADAQSYCLEWKKQDGGQRIPLCGDSLVIGRTAEAADHVDESTGISRAHVELVRVSGQWKVKDLGSRNGTRLNDESMAPYELYPLKPGDCLTLARSQYRFQLTEEN